MFRITDGKGFQITFENGWTVSVQFGFGNYCANRDNKSASMLFGMYDGPVESLTAEIAAWDKNGVWYDFGNDTVMGHVTPDLVAGFIDEVARKS